MDVFTASAELHPARRRRIEAKSNRHSNKEIMRLRVGWQAVGMAQSGFAPPLREPSGKHRLEQEEK
ncbi:MAG: hypothetical protein OXF82_03270, partial [Gammaproteobacteria bacterium]|nr:hypothetical protein [Gammaproteobacteria bacterium]